MFEYNRDSSGGTYMKELKEFATLVFAAQKRLDYVSLMRARDYHEDMVITEKMYPAYIKLYKELNYLIRCYNREYQKERLS